MWGEFLGENIKMKKEDVLWGDLEEDYLDYISLFQAWEDKLDLNNFLLFLLLREKKIIPKIPKDVKIEE